MRVGRKFGVARCAKFSKTQHGVAEFNGTAKQAQRIQCGKCLWAKQSVATLQIQHGENGAVFGRGTSLSLSLSLSLLALFGTLKFLNALFLGFCALFVILSIATQRVARRKPQQKNPHKLKENLLFLDTSLTLSMTANASLRAVFAKTAWQSINLALFLLFGLPRSLCSLAMTARQKFKFFIQNSRHFINSTHFVNSKHFTNSIHFITLSQIFEQFLLINLIERRSYGSSWHKRQDKNSRTD